LCIYFATCAVDRLPLGELAPLDASAASMPGAYLGELPTPHPPRAMFNPRF
jgi:hypothetical protein